MNNIVILFADSKSSYIFDKAFDGKSAFEMALLWAKNQNSEKIVVFGSPENEGELRDNISSVVKCGSVSGGDVDFVIKSLSEWTIHALMAQIKSSCEKYGSDYALYAWADCPFLNNALTKDIIEYHTEYASEYTFSEGFPYGFAPEAIDAGVARILSDLSEGLQKETGDKIVTRTSIFDLLKTDINSFEIETVLSDEDWRLFRFNFDAGTKADLISCKALFDSVKNDGEISEMNAETLSEIASKNKDIIKTLPSFYNIQLTDFVSGDLIYISDDVKKSSSRDVSSCRKIDFDSACKLIDEIASFSENAVISLSYFGEPFAHEKLLEIVKKILSHKGLSAFIETDGFLVTEETAASLKTISDEAENRTNGYEKIMFAVSLDAFTVQTYEKIHSLGEAEFKKALNAVSVFAKFFPSSVYPEFIRMNENEEELESFYRFWNEKSNPSNGNLIIQKYNSFCGELPDRKPADLSPLERNVCWHLRRDISILLNGDVSFCHARPFEIVGNVFDEGLEEIWKKTDGEVSSQIDKLCSKNENVKLCEKCGKCDEYYTFNF